MRSKLLKQAASKSLDALIAVLNGSETPFEGDEWDKALGAIFPFTYQRVFDILLNGDWIHNCNYEDDNTAWSGWELSMTFDVDDFKTWVYSLPEEDQEIIMTGKHFENDDIRAMKQSSSKTAEMESDFFTHGILDGKKREVEICIYSSGKMFVPMAKVYIDQVIGQVEFFVEGLIPLSEKANAPGGSDWKAIDKARQDAAQEVREWLNTHDLHDMVVDYLQKASPEEKGNLLRSVKQHEQLDSLHDDYLTALYTGYKKQANSKSMLSELSAMLSKAKEDLTPYWDWEWINQLDDLFDGRGRHAFDILVHELDLEEGSTPAGKSYIVKESIPDPEETLMNISDDGLLALNSLMRGPSSLDKQAGMAGYAEFKLFGEEYRTHLDLFDERDPDRWEAVLHPNYKDYLPLIEIYIPIDRSLSFEEAKVEAQRVFGNPEGLDDLALEAIREWAPDRKQSIMRYLRNNDHLLDIDERVLEALVSRNKTASESLKFKDAVAQTLAKYVGIDVHRSVWISKFTEVMGEELAKEAWALCVELEYLSAFTVGVWETCYHEDEIQEPMKFTRDLMELGEDDPEKQPWVDRMLALLNKRIPTTKTAASHGDKRMVDHTTITMFGTKMRDVSINCINFPDQNRACLWIHIDADKLLNLNEDLEPGWYQINEIDCSKKDGMLRAEDLEKYVQSHIPEFEEKFLDSICVMPDKFRLILKNGCKALYELDDRLVLALVSGKMS